ncbi:MAG TPA: hypothetical protein VF133_09070 [Terriglobales bacterium]
MTIESRLMASSLHAIAELDVSDRDREECDGCYDPKHILHKIPSLKASPLSHLPGRIQADQFGRVWSSAGLLCDFHSQPFSRSVFFAQQRVQEVQQKGATRESDCADYGCRSHRLPLLKRSSSEQFHFSIAGVRAD